MGVAMTTVVALREAGHDVVHLREQGLQRLADTDILEKAKLEARVVLTFDLDFGDLLALGLSAGPSVVLFRLSNETPSSVNPRLMQVIDECFAALDRGALLLIEDARYRVRLLPIRMERPASRSGDDE
jgi:predicted nuclease of predicted toxin-antitoxin system